MLTPEQSPKCLLRDGLAKYEINRGTALATRENTRTCRFAERPSVSLGKAELAVCLERDMSELEVAEFVEAGAGRLTG